MSIHNNEGLVYLCDWKKIGPNFEIRVRNTPEWKVVGSSFEEAESKLIQLLNDLNHDLQPCFEYSPEPPKGVVQARFEGPGILGVSGANDALEFLGNAGDLFSSGICPVCKKGIGERIQKSLTIQQYPQGDGAFVRVRVAGPYGNINIQIFSEDFLQALSSEEAARFIWIPVETIKYSKRKFFEPLSAPLVSRIMPKGLFSEAERLQADGFQCRKCGRSQLAGMPQKSEGLYTFIAEGDLPKTMPSCFQVGQLADLEFCMTRERWNTLIGKPGTKRLMSRQIGVVKRGWVNRYPKLQILE